MSGASPSLPHSAHVWTSIEDEKTDGRKEAFFRFSDLNTGIRLSLIFGRSIGEWERERVTIASYIISELLIGYCRGMRVGPAKGSLGPYDVRFLFAIVLDCTDINGPLYYLHPSSRRALNVESYFTRFFSLQLLPPTSPFSFSLAVFIIIPHSNIGIPVVCPTKDSSPRIFRSSNNRQGRMCTMSRSTLP